jgi:hypothetical protein
MDFLQVLEKIGVTTISIVSAIMSIWGLLTHLFRSGGMYKIARRRKIRGAWLAWFPITNEWMLGKICDHYQMQKYGHDTKRRGKLLTMAILMQSGALFAPLLKKVPGWLGQSDLLGVLKMLQARDFIWLSLGALAVGLVIAVLSLIQMIIQYKAYYSLFASCKPKAAVPFLILTIMTPANPFLVFACRKSDGGMPVQTEA